MQILDENSELKTSGIVCSVALGMFDGVHLGHREVISRAVEHAKATKTKSAVITLANHPRELTEGRSPSLITNLASRLDLFAGLGLDYVLILNFDQRLREIPAREFFEKFLLSKLNADFISVGYDHHFGKDRSGNPSLLKDWCDAARVTCEIIQPLKVAGLVVSSSVIRELIERGDIESANKLLGYEFLMIATVIEGEGLGKQLGFPTANLDQEANLILPALGVYSGFCSLVGEDAEYQCVVNIGTRPSFVDTKKINIEVHILNFSQNIYGRTLRLSLSRRLRDECKFASSDELVNQIKKDIAETLTRV